MTKQLLIDPQKETEKVTRFIHKTFEEQGLKNAVIGLSGGIDSAVSLYLLRKTLSVEQIYILHMPYFTTDRTDIKLIINKLNHPINNIHIISIAEPVNTLAKTLKLQPEKPGINKIRLGNIAARVRMITLFDYAKKINGMVVGTENKSEHYLAYFTRFGDAASDIEPIQHLYKTQIYQLAEYLEIPQEIIKKAPSADLWQGQSDELEFGFTYSEADMVLHLYLDKKEPLNKITAAGYKNAGKIIDWVKRNEFKHKTPYKM